jgi:hypothetical protein
MYIFPGMPCYGVRLHAPHGVIEFPGKPSTSPTTHRNQAAMLALTL